MEEAAEHSLHFRLAPPPPSRLIGLDVSDSSRCVLYVCTAPKYEIAACVDECIEPVHLYIGSREPVPDKEAADRGESNDW